MRMGMLGHPINLLGHPHWSQNHLDPYGRDMFLRQRTPKEHDAHAAKDHKRLLCCQTATVNTTGPPRGAPAQS